MATSMKNATTSPFHYSPLLALQWAAGRHASGSWNAAVADILVALTHPTTALLLVASIVYLFYHLLLLKQRAHSAKGEPQLPPGPPGLPLIGNLHELFRQKPMFRWILSYLKQTDAGIACIKMGSVHVVPVSCPEIAREFLKKQDANFCDRPKTMGTEYSSRGYLSVAVAPWGDQWKKMRRVIASEVVNPARLRWLLQKRTQEADNLVRHIYNLTSTSADTIDIRAATRHYSANVIRRMMFDMRHFGAGGAVAGAPGVEEEEHVDSLFQVLGLLYAFNVADYVPALRSLDLNGHEKTMKKAIKVVNSYHDPIVEERIKRWRESTGCGNKEPQDLLDVLISLKDSDGNWMLTTEEIKAQSNDLIYASVDNPSNATEWALVEMLNQPALLQRAAEEIDRVVGRDRLVQESDVPQLNYVKACAREAFRLHPIAPFNLPHVAINDAVVAGYHIPAGSHVLLSRVGLGRNPSVWKDPQRFDPERHLKESGPGGEVSVELSESDLRFISFSTGRRGCMGVALGSAMTVMLLARLIQGFEWTPAKPGSVDLSEGAHDLFPAEPLCARAKPRLPEHVYAAAAEAADAK